jgi:murein DD-endopeptidase MepM/ murein hydrolase activator NlpD
MIFLLIAALLLGGGALLFFLKFEGEVPTLALTPEPRTIGRETVLSLVSEDKRSGLREIRVEILQGGQSHSVLVESFPAGTERVDRTLTVSPATLGLQDGEAVFRAEVRDRSWRGGNPRTLEAKVIIDTRPPTVTVLSRFHYLNQGGSGAVVYRASEPLSRSGVEVDGRWFLGFPLGDTGGATLFAIPHDASPKAQIALLAEDVAGNRTRIGFPYQIRPKAFRNDSIQVSEEFLERVMPYFTDRDPALRGEMSDVFLKVNREMRKANEERIRELCRQTSPVPLWSGPFLRMANAKPMAGFADRRVYLYGGKEIDRQVHMGVDLASLAMSPVEAANRGRVVFVGELGIYGNMVLLDHGLGLFSMYSHLSQIRVKPDQEVSKGELLGTTGNTGLAGGDHLHFAMLVAGVYVSPVEWWDPHWMEDNVDGKFALLKSEGK